MAHAEPATVLRGDIARVERCTAITTGGDSGDTVKRSKPFKYAYEKEIVMYVPITVLFLYSLIVDIQVCVLQGDLYSRSYCLLLTFA